MFSTLNETFNLGKNLEKCVSTAFDVGSGIAAALTMAALLTSVRPSDMVHNALHFAGARQAAVGFGEAAPPILAYQSELAQTYLIWLLLLVLGGMMIYPLTAGSMDLTYVESRGKRLLVLPHAGFAWMVALLILQMSPRPAALVDTLDHTSNQFAKIVLVTLGAIALLAALSATTRFGRIGLPLLRGVFWATGRVLASVAFVLASLALWATWFPAKLYHLVARGG